jgi:predicted ATP-dependent endonuclease of OLD family
MLIKCVEIQNFRKLKCVRIDLTDRTTVFVGANNSGKTSAMIALGHFLVDEDRFHVNDFTLSNLAHLNAIGRRWEGGADNPDSAPAILDEWIPHLPSLDVWLDVGGSEIHYVRHLLPTLSWAGGLIGVRLRLEPKTMKALHDEFVKATATVKQTLAAAQATGKSTTATLWPRSMSDFLSRRLGRLFEVKAYPLDPAKLVLSTKSGEARPQILPPESEALVGDPFEGLVRIDEIGAQRGFADASYRRGSSGEVGESRASRSGQRLSEQLKAYYASHLDPTEFPEPHDLDALASIETAQQLFDERLEAGFSPAFKEVETLGYPGVMDPKLKIATQLRPVDGMSHSAAVQYEVLSHVPEQASHPLRLPEDYNGLGYQNLISMVFKLMAFRDAWMKVGKAGKSASASETSGYFSEPLHVVLVEEPEVHLHAQVQQVFIRKAYDILRAHDDLRENAALRTQLLVSTHSSHIAHESDFANIRYFRRVPAARPGDVPAARVINLGDVFGPGDETRRFIRRYLRAVHSDLLFADAAIIVEGPAERILLPHFVISHFPKLNQRYVSILEIGGSHAHTLRPLIEHLGLLTLIVTDIDCADANGIAVVPERGKGYVTRNTTLKKWVPCKVTLDELLDLPPAQKVKTYDTLFSVRAAYQSPTMVQLANQPSQAEALPSTFEDALVFENLATFAGLPGGAEVGKFRDAIAESQSAPELGQKMFEILKTASKARFALDVLFVQEPGQMNVPGYIVEGLAWLESRLQVQDFVLTAAQSSEQSMS